MREKRIIFVSTNDPEAMPSLKASRKGSVADIRSQTGDVGIARFFTSAGEREATDWKEVYAYDWLSARLLNMTSGGICHGAGLLSREFVRCQAPAKVYKFHNHMSRA